MQQSHGRPVSTPFDRALVVGRTLRPRAHTAGIVGRMGAKGGFLCSTTSAVFPNFSWCSSSSSPPSSCFTVFKGIAQWSYNNAQPVLNSPAHVVTKRTRTSGGGGVNTPSSVSTYYYATFDMDGGQRQEFSVSGHEYGLLAEGDRGMLTFQGTRYKGFARGTAPAS